MPTDLFFFPLSVVSLPRAQGGKRGIGCNEGHGSLARPVGHTDLSCCSRAALPIAGKFNRVIGTASRFFLMLLFSSRRGLVNRIRDKEQSRFDGYCSVPSRRGVASCSMVLCYRCKLLVVNSEGEVRTFLLQNRQSEQQWVDVKWSRNKLVNGNR